VTAALASVPRETSAPAQRLEELPLASIDVGENVRVNIADLDALAASIQEHGVLQPIKVRPAGKRWLVVWGQRRYLAARQVGLETIPALIDDDVERAPETLAIEQLVENLHRADLPALDRARAMRAVVDAGTSQVDLARELGLHPSTIANDLGLLDAPREIQKLIEDEVLTPSHAKALKGLVAKTQVELAKDAIARGSSAHELEQSVQRHKQQQEWERTQQARTHEQNAGRLTSILSGLSKKKAQPGDRIHVVSWSGGTGEVAAAIRKAGFTNVVTDRSGAGSKADALECDCSAWIVELGYGSPSVKPACVVQAHRDAKMKADRMTQDATWKAASDGRAALRAHIEAELVDTPASRLWARALLWSMIGWNLKDWAKARQPAVKKPDPWTALSSLTDAEVRAELATRIAERMGSSEAPVPWDRIVAEISGTATDPEPAAPAKPAAKAKPKFTPAQAAAAAAELDAEGLT